MRRSSPRRRGLTLLEVVVSMAIFLIAVIAIWQLITIGTERALDMKLQAETSLRCESKMAEIMIGKLAPQGTGGYQPDEEPFEEFEYKVLATERNDIKKLYDVVIWVRATSPSGGTVESSLAQSVMDPSIRGSTMDRPPPPEASKPTEDAPMSETPMQTPTTPTPMATPTPMQTPMVPMVPMGGGKK